MENIFKDIREVNIIDNMRKFLTNIYEIIKSLIILKLVVY